MTEERSEVSADQGPATLTTGDAARQLKPVADQLGLRMDTQKVRRLAQKGIIQGVRLNGTGWWMVYRTSVDRFQEELERQVRQAK